MTLKFTEQRDLYSGEPAWPDPVDLPADPLPDSCDIAIIGCGIMGAMLAERLARPGRSLLLLDAREPLTGASRASTAQVSAATDFTLTELGAVHGEEQAGAIWRRLQDAADALRRKIDDLGLDRYMSAVPSVLLEGSKLDRSGLRAEHDRRLAAALPYEWLEPEAVATRFGLHGSAAILAPRDFTVDPVGLCTAMLERARGLGSRICWPQRLSGLSQEADGLILELADGARVRASRAILATGYERPPFHLPPEFTVGSTFVIAAEPPPTGEPVSFWTSDEPYLYGRPLDGRLLAGGEDTDDGQAPHRDALIGAKSGIIAAELSSLMGHEVTVSQRWAATFGSSPDSLPAIGRARNADHLWLAYGYGGNGVTFAALAAEVLAAQFDEGAPLPQWTDPYRFE